MHTCLSEPKPAIMEKMCVLLTRTAHSLQNTKTKWYYGSIRRSHVVGATTLLTMTVAAGLQKNSHVVVEMLLVEATFQQNGIQSLDLLLLLVYIFFNGLGWDRMVDEMNIFHHPEQATPFFGRRFERFTFSFWKTGANPRVSESVRSMAVISFASSELLESPFLEYVFVSLASNRSPEKKRRRVEDMNETAGFGAPELFLLPNFGSEIAETERIWVNFYTPKDTETIR